MISKEQPAVQNVAVVGTGMAGLATAYLLNHDFRQRYSVTVFENGQSFALDSASVSVHDATAEVVDRVDLPMRAFAAGYYENLISMYRYLDVRFRSQPFIYSFEKDLGTNLWNGAKSEPYFIHTSNNHRMPPIRPSGVGLINWVLEVVYVALCYVWWSICCSLIAPIPASISRECESLGEYVRRVKLPSYFTNFYLLPLIASVSTCSHKELFNFPAKDLLDYKMRSAGKQHYTVAGVFEVQKRLGQGLEAVLNATVTNVQPLTNGRLQLTWKTNDGRIHDEVYDRVILAVAPDVVGRIFEPLRTAMARIPSTTVRSMLQAGGMTISKYTKDGNMIDRYSSTCARKAQVIHFRTSATRGQTESVHVHPSGAKVITCPFEDSLAARDILCTAQFQRALRTPVSRRIVNNLFGEEVVNRPSDEKASAWKNGDNNVWLVGGWCWDGMVLLEGCIVSAVRVARDFDVEVPWNHVDA